MASWGTVQGLLFILHIAVRVGMVRAAQMRLSDARDVITFVEASRHDFALKPIRFGSGGSKTLPNVILSEFAVVASAHSDWVHALGSVLQRYEAGAPVTTTVCVASAQIAPVAWQTLGFSCGGELDLREDLAGSMATS